MKKCIIFILMLTSLKCISQNLATNNFVIFGCYGPCDGLEQHLIFHSNLGLKNVMHGGHKHSVYLKKKDNQFYDKYSRGYASLFNEIYLNEMNYNLLCDYIIKNNIEKTYSDDELYNNNPGYHIRIYKNGQKAIEYFVITPDYLNDYLTKLMKIINKMNINENALREINLTFGYNNGHYLGNKGGRR